MLPNDHIFSGRGLLILGSKGQIPRRGPTMKKLLAAATAIVALAATSPVWAADLPPPMIAKAPPPPPWYDWTGFYIGGNGGYSWGRGATNYTVAGRAPFSTTQA